MKSARIRAGLWLLGLLALLVPAGVVLAQDDEMAGAAVAGAVGLMMVVFFVIFAAIYVYKSLAISTIAKKTNTPNAWWGWVPILDVLLLLTVAKKPLWWILLCFIPLVNLVIGIIVMMAVAEARGKPNWWGILIIVPFVGIIVPGYLAWAD